MSLIKMMLVMVSVAAISKTFGLLRRSEERFSRNAETDLVCRLLLEKKKCLAEQQRDRAARDAENGTDHVGPPATCECQRRQHATQRECQHLRRRTTVRSSPHRRRAVDGVHVRWLQPRETPETGGHDVYVVAGGGEAARNVRRRIPRASADRR